MKVSNTRTNPNRLFYTCREKQRGFFQWCSPINANMFAPCKFKDVDAKEVEEVSWKKSNLQCENEKYLTKVKKQLIIESLKLLVLVSIGIHLMLSVMTFIGSIGK